MSKRKILLLGGGGREHAFAWKLSRSPRCERLFIAPGNPGTAECGENAPLNPNDFPGIARFIREREVDLLVVGPEAPLVEGLADHLREREGLHELLIIGPGQAGARLEGSKSWAKHFMEAFGIPTAKYREFSAGQLDEGLAYLETHPLPIVLKADGLAAGKGVVICPSREEARAELRAMLEGKFGAASRKVVIEEFLSGIEFSVFVLTDGKDWVVLPEAKDYKRVGEGDTGPNTGGMGAVSPVPFADETLMGKVSQRIIEPTIRGLRARGIPYRGFLFLGLINVAGEPFVIEYNCRMGDPETQVVFPRLKNDLVELFEALENGSLSEVTLEFDPRSAATVVLVSGGYPGAYDKGKPIEGLEQVEGSIVFHAGTKVQNGQLVTSGGRVLALTSFGEDFRTAVRRSLQNAERIHFEGKYFRKDIGFDLG